jgi:DNA-binding IclR family transcriptional regulator
VTEVARQLGIANSTAHRLLTALCRSGLLEQNPATKRYVLSLLLHRLGNLAAISSDLHRAAFLPLERLHQKTGEGCHVAVLDVPEVVYVERRDSDRTMHFITRMGVRAPANCTSTGKVLLAFAPAPTIEALLATGLRRLTPSSITDAARLAEELEAIRERGYAVSHEEGEIGTTSVAAPVREASGRVVAALGVAAATACMTRHSLTRAVDLTLRGSQEISEALTASRRRTGVANPLSTGLWAGSFGPTRN